MPLQSGEIFGSYEIVAAIGHGGMGEVYSARDLRLQRKVAIKVLPDALAADPDRLARFQREAEVLASLSHPNISAIHGVEEFTGRKALILELVDGPTLSERIAKGPIPIDEALVIARQIAEALESAHESGIIHRDLKPSNIKVRDDGTVKVLDFGLAKLAQAPESARHLSDLSQSPTITSPALATHAGVILGTAAYMSPEQAKGKPVDKRSDMWAFGCVLFEMLTGTRAFEGEDVSDTLAEVLKSEPKWNALPAATPESVRRLLRRCLAKDRHARLADAAVARLEIDEVTYSVAQAPSSVATSGRRRLAALLILLATTAVPLTIWLRRDPLSIDASVTRFTIQLPAGLERPGGLAMPLAISRDGRRIAFIAGPDEADRRIWVRSLSELEPIALRGTEGAVAPFFSPDGTWIAYFDSARGGVRKIVLEGSADLPIPVANDAGLFRGGSWGADGSIVFGSSSSGGLMRVADTGGAAAPLTKPAGEVHSRPYFLPDGRALLFNIGRPDKPTQIAMLSLDSGDISVLLEGDEPRVTAQGFLVFRRGEILWAAPFDAGQRKLTGAPTPFVDGPRGGSFDVADNGTLVYTPPRDSVDQRSVVWVDRRGAEQPTDVPARAYVYPRISPDGTQFALDIRDQQNDIWIWHTLRRTMTRLTFSPALDRFPVWTPDGKRIAYTADGAGISWQTADGSGTVERILNSSNLLQSFQGANNAFPSSFSPDGTKLLFWGNSTSDIQMLPLQPRGGSAPLLETPFNERNPEMSPDGRWVAYESNESGRFEIHVRPFPDLTKGKWQVSTDGGSQPLWARNGSELFFRSPSGAVMRVGINTSGSFSPGAPARIFEGLYFLSATAIIGRTYDVSPDGQRFLMIKSMAQPNQTADYLIAVQNAFVDFQQEK